MLYVLTANSCPDEQLSGLASALSIPRTPSLFDDVHIGAINTSHLLKDKTKQGDKVLVRLGSIANTKVEEDAVFSLCGVIMLPYLGNFLTTSTRVYCACWPLWVGGSIK